MFAFAKTAAGGAYWSALPSATRTALTAVTGMSLVQVGLGISTLLLYVPVPLAAVHQAGSLVLLTIITAAVHSLNFATHSMAGGSVRAQQTQLLSTVAMVQARQSSKAVTPAIINAMLCNSTKASTYSTKVINYPNKE